MQLYTIGVNHTTAPIAIREHVSFQPEELSNALKSVTQFGASEAAILSTCNRTELYVTAENPAIITSWLADYQTLAAVLCIGTLVVEIGYVVMI